MAPARRPSFGLRSLAAVAVGGALGALGRHLVDELVTADVGGWPLSTLVVNLTGSFAIGWFLTAWLRRHRPDSVVRLVVAVGVLGAFTTFSAVAVEIDRLVADGALVAATSYLVATVVGALALCWLGMRIGRADHRPTRSPEQT